MLAFFALGPPLLVPLNADSEDFVHVVPFYMSSESRYMAKTSLHAPQDDAQRGETAAKVFKRCFAEMGGAAGATGCISRCGRIAFVGSVKGELSLVKLDSMKVICHVTCSETKLRVMHVHASANEDKILINGYDRTMRVYDVDMAAVMRLAEEETETGAALLPPALRLVHVYKNSVENFAWGNCCISHDCRYVVGSPSVRVSLGDCLPHSPYLSLSLGPLERNVYAS